MAHPLSPILLEVKKLDVLKSDVPPTNYVVGVADSFSLEVQFNVRIVRSVLVVEDFFPVLGSNAPLSVLGNEGLIFKL